MRPTRVLYVENDPALRGILAYALQQHPGLDLRAAVSDADAAIAEARAQHYDVALVDLALGNASMNGHELGLALRDIIDDIGIVIYSQHAVSDFTRALPERVRFGWSVIQKRADVGIDHLADVLKATARGESVIDTQVIKAREESAVSPIEQLTLRQRQIIALAASGVDANIIAEELGLAPVTIRQELSRIYAVLVPDPKRGTDLRTTAVLRYLRETRRYEQAGGE